MTLAAGDPTVTCAITNDDEPVELIIEKSVINDDGGTATVDDFGITTTAGALIFGAAVEIRPTRSRTPPRPSGSQPAPISSPRSKFLRVRAIRLDLQQR